MLKSFIAAACKPNNWRSIGEIAADLVRTLEAKSAVRPADFDDLEAKQ